ncbi:MAG: DUF192 domain-containing protein [Thermaerobacter sp.]|nr:DUF192 domain-containing protein [Thermaerobacter sp.]
MSDGRVLAEHATLANTFWSRFRGLMGRSTLLPGTAFVFPRTNAIHTFFMRFPIDVVFVDREGRIVRIVKRVPPWRMGPVAWSAAWTVELPAGTLVGDEVDGVFE